MYSLLYLYFYFDRYSNCITRLMSVMEGTIRKLLEQNETQENDSSPRVKPKSFFWDTIIFSLASAIIGLSISEITVGFFKSDENSVACYYNSSKLQNQDQYTYINNYCYKYLSDDKHFSLLLVAQAASLIVPHHLWKTFFSTLFDSFFIHAARVQILRERNTGQYPIKNYTIVHYLHREFACRWCILRFYYIKLFVQLLFVVGMIYINTIWFTKLNNDITFECSNDKQVFSNVTCVNPRRPFIIIILNIDHVLLYLVAALIILVGIVRCFVGCCVSTENYEKTANICYKSCIDPQYYYKPSLKSSICWIQINNDFEFLLALLHFGLGRVFKTILIENEIYKQAVKDLENLPQRLRKGN